MYILIQVQVCVHVHVHGIVCLHSVNDPTSSVARSSDSLAHHENADVDRDLDRDLEMALGLFMNNDMSRVTYGVYITHDLFVDTTHDCGINSRVVASKVNGFRIYNLSTPVFASFRMLEVRCVI